MTKEEIQELLDATNIVCLNCVENTLTQEEICEKCPVRKLVSKALDEEEKQN